MSPSETRPRPPEETVEDFYQILGVEPDATPEQIRTAYRDLARQYHPDAGLVSGTSVFFRHIQEAYETLRDPERRQHYDEALRRQGRRAPATLEIQITLGPTQLPCLDEPQLLYALLSIRPFSAHPISRTPLNLCLVLDQSTSMKGERLAAIKEATFSLVEQLETEDLFSLVAFADRATVLIPAGQKPERRALRSALNSLNAGGGTEIYQGLSRGLAEVRRVCSGRQINHVILLTDGHTYGDAEACLAAAKAAARENIGISGIGVGNDWSEDFLDLLASAGGGTVLYIEHSADVGRAFERRLRDLKDAWIPDLSLRLRYDPRAEHKDIFAIAPELRRLPWAEGVVTVGPLQRADERILLLEILVGVQAEGRHRLLQVEARGSAPALGSPAVCRRSLWVDFLPAGHTRPLVPASIIEAARNVSLLRMQERAHEEAQQGLIRPATRRMAELATSLLRRGQTDLARAIQAEAEQLAATGSYSEGGAKRIRYGTRAIALPVRKE